MVNQDVLLPIFKSFLTNLFALGHATPLCSTLAKPYSVFIVSQSGKSQTHICRVDAVPKGLMT